MPQLKLQNGIPAKIKTFYNVYTMVIEQVFASDFEINECQLVFKGQALLKETVIKMIRIVNKHVVVPVQTDSILKIEYPLLELEVVASYNNDSAVTFNYRFE